MDSFQLGNRTYFVKKMDVFKQAHVARRVGPILANSIPMLQGLFKDAEEIEKMSAEQKLEKIAPLAPVVMNGLASLSDKDFDYVLHSLLECVSVAQGSATAALFANGTLMFQDLELPALLQLAGRAFMKNVAGFFSALPQ